jgi:hypothetical protein
MQMGVLVIPEFGTGLSESEDQWRISGIQFKNNAKDTELRKDSAT